MQNQKRSIVIAYMVQAACILGQVRNVPNGGTKQFCAVGIGNVLCRSAVSNVVWRHRQKLGGTKPITDGLYAAGDVFFAGTRPCSHQCDQVTTGRRPHRTNPCRIDSILVGVFANPTHRTVAIFDLCRPLGNIGQAIVDRGDRESMIGKPRRVLSSTILTTIFPATAMHKDNARSGTLCFS